MLKCAKRIKRKLNKLMKSSPIYDKLQHYLIEHACIIITSSYINMCRLNKNREWRKERERGAGGNGVCSCFLGELLEDYYLWIYPNLSASLTDLLVDKNDVIRGLMYRHINIFVVNKGRSFCNIRIFECRCCFFVH